MRLVHPGPGPNFSLLMFVQKLFRNIKIILSCFHPNCQWYIATKCFNDDDNVYCRTKVQIHIEISWSNSVVIQYLDIDKIKSILYLVNKHSAAWSLSAETSDEKQAIFFSRKYYLFYFHFF